LQISFLAVSGHNITFKTSNQRYSKSNVTRKQEIQQFKIQIERIETILKEIRKMNIEK